MYFRYKEGPGNPLRCTYEGTLKDLFPAGKPKGPKKLFYQQLSIPVNELENKKAFKVIKIFGIVWLKKTFNYHNVVIILAIIVSTPIFFCQVLWVGNKMKEEKEIFLYPNKGARVAELLEEARKNVELSPDGSGKLRYVWYY